MESTSLTLLQSSLARLKINLALAQGAETAGGDVFKAFRDATIQSFEYTYDSAIKFLKRYIEDHPNTPDIDSLQLRDLLRLAVEISLIDDDQPWIAHRASRNYTSHTYDEQKASRVFASIPAFVIDADILITNAGRLLHVSHS